MEGVIFTTTVRKVSTLVDGSLTITLETPELNNEEAARLLGLRKVQGVAYISPKPINSAMTDTIDGMTPEITGGKSPSKRLRDVLFVWWRQDQQGYDDFELFYLRQMDLITQGIKEKLKP